MAGTGGSGGMAGTGGSGTGGTAGSSGSGGTSGTGGSGGTGGAVMPCGGKCTDAEAECVSDTCTCNSGFTNTDTDGDPQTATCTHDDTIESTTVSVGIDHTRLGNLVIKLVTPDGTVIALMNRPGFNESSDDGTDGNEGDGSDLDSGFPVRFSDSAQYDAEGMGQYINAAGQAVCRDDSSQNGGPGTKICDYSISPGAAGGPSSLGAGSNGKRASGQWQLCVGDAVSSREGKLQNVALEVMTVGGPLSVSAMALNQIISDDAYDGSLGSMTCAMLSL